MDMFNDSLFQETHIIPSLAIHLGRCILGGLLRWPRSGVNPQCEPSHFGGRSAASRERCLSNGPGRSVCFGDLPSGELT